MSYRQTSQHFIRRNNAHTIFAKMWDYGCLLAKEKYPTTEDLLESAVIDELIGFSLRRNISVELIINRVRMIDKDINP